MFAILKKVFNMCVFGALVFALFGCANTDNAMIKSGYTVNSDSTEIKFDAAGFAEVERMANTPTGVISEGTSPRVSIAYELDPGAKFRHRTVTRMEMSDTKSSARYQIPDGVSSENLQFSELEVQRIDEQGNLDLVMRKWKTLVNIHGANKTEFTSETQTPPSQHSEYYVTMDSKAQVVGTRGVEESLRKMYQNQSDNTQESYIDLWVAKDMNDPQFKASLASPPMGMFGFPKPLGVGANWCVGLVSGNLHMATFYTLDRIENDTLFISSRVYMAYSIDKNDPNDKSSSRLWYKDTGSQNVNRRTGIVLHSSTTAEMTMWDKSKDGSTSLHSFKYTTIMEFLKEQP